MAAQSFKMRKAGGKAKTIIQISATHSLGTEPKQNKAREKDSKEKTEHLGPHDLPNGRVKLLGVVVVHRHDVRPADVLLCVWVLGGHLEMTLTRRNKHTHTRAGTSPQTHT